MKFNLLKKIKEDQAPTRLVTCKQCGLVYSYRSKRGDESDGYMEDCMAHTPFDLIYIHPWLALGDRIN